MSIKVEELLFPSHILDIIELSEEYAKEMPMDEYIDEEVLIESCNLCMHDTARKQLNCFVAYKDKKAIGFLVGVTTKSFYRNMVVAEQKLWYVTPKARGSRAALVLMREYERWARLNGATHIYTGTANKHLAETTSNILTRIGYEPVGSIHLKVTTDDPRIRD